MYDFRQDSTFYYLTGFDEPDTIALLRPGAEAPFVMFVRPHDPDMAIWVGARTGIDGVIADYGADEAYPIEELKQRLPELLAEIETLYYPLGVDDEVDALVSTHVARRRQGAQAGGEGAGQPQRSQPARRRDASAQVRARGGGAESRRQPHRERLRAGDAHDAPRHARVRGAGDDGGGVPPPWIAAQRLPLDRRRRPRLVHSPLHDEPQGATRRRPAADRRGRRVGTTTRPT